MMLRWIAGGLLTSAVALLKRIPAVGVAPWACAMVDTVFLALLLCCAQRGGLHTALCAAVLMPLIDWVQGAIPGYWVPFLAAGFATAAWIWKTSDARRLPRAVLSAIAAYVWRVVGVTVGYIVLRDMAVSEALRSVVRNSWFVFAWYAGLVAAYALLDWLWEQKSGATS